jgi:hypothetical protein
MNEIDDETNRDVRQSGATSERPYARHGNSKYTPATVRRLLAAIADGLTYKSACITAGIGVTTLADWRRDHPELELRMEEAKEKARHKMLKTIKRAADDDWRAAAEYLKLVHAEDYRRVQQQTNQHLHVHGDTHVTLSVEKQAEIREQRRRIIATSRDAQRALSGTSEPGDDEQAQSYRIKRQSLLAEPQPEQQPEQPLEAEVIEAEVIEQQPEQQERPDLAFQEWHKVADARHKEADEAAEAWARLGLR